MWIKLALNEIGPVTLVAFRVLFGFLFGAALIFIQRVQIPRDFKTWRSLIILGITNIAAPFFLISWGELYVDSSEASVLDATVPLFTIFIAHYLLDDDKMNLSKILGLVTGFAGVVVLLSKDIGVSTSTLLGQAAIVLASIFYAGSAVFIRRTTQNTPGVLRSAGPLLSASVFMWPAVFISNEPVILPEAGITWIALLFLGIVGSGLAFVMAFYLIHEIGPTRLSMVTYIFPLGGVTLGVLTLNEQITWQLITGAVLIIASIAVANWHQAEVPALSKIKSEEV